MLIITHTIETTLSPKQIWGVLVDFENWGKWDKELESCGLDGAFQPGVTGYIKLKDGPRLNTLITYVEPFRFFVQEAKLLLAKAVMTHTIAQVSEKTKITFQTEIRGPFSLLYYYLIGSGIKKKVPIEMEEMLKLVKPI
jgi:hypothetical protein